MQIDIKCCRKKKSTLEHFFHQIVLGSVPRRFEGNPIAGESYEWRLTCKATNSANKSLKEVYLRA